MSEDYFRHLVRGVVALVITLGLVGLWNMTGAAAASPAPRSGQRLLTVHEHGAEDRTIITESATVGDALKEAGIPIERADAVEPAVSTEMSAKNYQVNIYRARPIVIVDGQSRSVAVTAEQSPKRIMEAAGLTLHDEDKTSFDRVDEVLAEGGAGLKLVVDRATPFVFTLYGKTFEARTQAATIGEMLREKGVILGANDGASLPMETAIQPGMVVSVWRNGEQTITEEQAIDFPVKQIRDADKPVGYKQIQVAGTRGKKLVTYQVELRDGKEVSRKEIQSVAVEQPKEQVEVVGAKLVNGLSKSKGVIVSTDSNGVAHRETYYDLPMGGVMRACGGTYSVREDGAKVDQDGYILVAANLSRYPRCSVVETSLGLGKVYDTGGFVAVHPDGFDLATDWSNYDGR